MSVRVRGSSKDGKSLCACIAFRMLNITAQKNAEAAKEYFSRSDYYASVDEQEIVGQWGGRAAVLLGLFGKVDKPSFDRLCDNQHPKTGEPLSKITRDGRRVGYDFTLSAPKSVSVLHALTGDESIMQAWRDSVRETMDAIECEMQTRVRKNGQETDRTTGNLGVVGIRASHLTAGEQYPLPAASQPLFVQNLTFDSIEGQWKAGQFGRIKSYGYYWQAAQQARFALKLEELGFATRPTKDAFEIVGVPDSIIPKFSHRTGVIERTAAKLGITDPKRKAGLAATTREKKERHHSRTANCWSCGMAGLRPMNGPPCSTSPTTRSRKHPTVDNERHANFADRPHLRADEHCPGAPAAHAGPQAWRRPRDAGRDACGDGRSGIARPGNQRKGLGHDQAGPGRRATHAGCRQCRQRGLPAARRQRAHLLSRRSGSIATSSRRSSMCSLRPMP